MQRHHSDDEQDTDWSSSEEVTQLSVPQEKEVDECIQNARCEGNCAHVECQLEPTNDLNEPKVTCHNCKENFRDKVTMMDHKRDSDHPSKRKCNKLPDCERGSECWFVHNINKSPQANIREQSLSCNTCHNNCGIIDLMFNKKKEHPEMFTKFQEGSCRRNTSCWFLHNQLPPAPSVARNQLNLPPPGTTSWNTDFPQHPTMGPVVGFQQ